MKDDIYTTSYRIENPADHEIVEFDGLTASAVYLGGLDDLKKCNQYLDWHIDDTHANDFGRVFKYLTLDEIAKQLCHDGLRIITIIHNDPKRSRILQYGNYGDEWWVLGGVMGYA